MGGAENYIEVLSDPEFWASLRFTVLYIVVTVLLVILIGFFIALLLDQVTKYRAILLQRRCCRLS